MPKIPMATSSASRLVPGLAEKQCHNVYPEPHPNDPQNEIALVEAPGSLQRNTYAAACRGMWQWDGFASGKVIIAQGTTLSTYTPSTDTAGSLTGSTAGTDRGDFAVTETQGFGLFNGGLYYSDGTSITAVSDVDFASLLSAAGATAFTSVATLGQRGLFTFGNRFGYTAVLDINNTTALNYYTCESSPDDIKAVRVLGELAVFFNSRTIEFWAQTGDTDDPYALQPGMTQQVGSACRDGIVATDNSLFFVDDAFNVRRLGQGGSPIISESWVAKALREAGASDIIGWTYQDGGHIFVGWRTSDGCYVYDVQTGMWHTRGTNETDTWRYTDVVTAGARVFVCDGTGQFDELSRDYLSESMANSTTMGTEIVREFTAYMPSIDGREPIASIRLDSAKGVGVASGQGSAPIIRLRQSFDQGSTWTGWTDASLGALGDYDTRTIWRRRGQTRAPGIVFHFLKSDPVECAYLGVVVNEDAA